MATLYFTNSSDNIFDNLNNWWEDESFTIPASVLPGDGDSMYILGNVDATTFTNYNYTQIYVGRAGSGSDGWTVNLVSVTSSPIDVYAMCILNDAPLATNVTFHETASLTGNVNTCTFLDDSYMLNGSVNSATFRGNSYMADGNVTDVILNDLSEFQNGTAQNITCYDTSKISGGTITSAIFYNNSYLSSVTAVIGTTTLYDASLLNNGNLTIIKSPWRRSGSDLISDKSGGVSLEFDNVPVGTSSDILGAGLL